MSRLPIVAILILFLLQCGLLHAQTENRGAYDEAWLEYEAAEQLARDHSQPQAYAEALRRYARALELQPLFPEAYVGMARVYVAVSDTVLAERYFRNALTLADQLQIPDEKYAIRMELAKLFDGFRPDPQYDEKYRNELLFIIEDDPTFSNNDPPGQRQQMRRTLLESGIDRVIVLYRLNFPPSVRAHQLYARYLIETGEPTPETAMEAIDHLLFAIVEVVGRGVEVIIDREYDYQFTTIVDFIEHAKRYDAILDYVETENLVRLLNELSGAFTLIDHPSASVRRAELEEQIMMINLLLSDR